MMMSKVSLTNACKILMKTLWLGRLARPDIVNPIGDLANTYPKVVAKYYGIRDSILSAFAIPGMPLSIVTLVEIARSPRS